MTTQPETPLPGTPVPQEQIDAVARPQADPLHPSVTTLLNIALTLHYLRSGSTSLAVSFAARNEIQDWLTAMGPYLPNGGK